MSQTPEAGLELETKFFFLAFILYLFKPRIEIDGGPPGQLQWGVNRVPLSAGQHQMLVYFPYLFIRKCGRAEFAFAVAPGQVVQARYTAPWLVYLRGHLVQTGLRPMVDPGAASAPAPAPGAAMPAYQPAPAPTQAAPAPADWYPDPAGRHQHRYWDGQQWTANVADAGATGTDPL